MGHNKTALWMSEIFLRMMGWNGMQLESYSPGFCLWRSILENRLDIRILSVLRWKVCRSDMETLGSIGIVR